MQIKSCQSDGKTGKEFYDNTDWNAQHRQFYIAEKALSDVNIKMLTFDIISLTLLQLQHYKKNT